MKNLLVSDVMTRDPVVLPPDSSLFDCVKKMVKNRISSVLLVQDKRLVGLISQKDVMWVLTKKPAVDLRSIRSIDISPKKLATIKPDFTIRVALDKMKKLKFERLPVIYENQLVGVVTIKDILIFNPEIYPELEEMEKIREQSDKLKRVQRRNLRSITPGICEECGHSDFLQFFNGMKLCESCISSM